MKDVTCIQVTVLPNNYFSKAEERWTFRRKNTYILEIQYIRYMTLYWHCLVHGLDTKYHLQLLARIVCML